MNICIIGGGASGMMCAIHLAKGGQNVILLEKNEKLGKKMYITGKGRCNITNDCEMDEFFKNIIHGEKFLKSAVYSFTPQDTMDFFEKAGLSLKVERGNRVFPMSDKSSDVIKTLENELKRSGVQVYLNKEVVSIEKNNSIYTIKTSNYVYEADIVVIATGGISYPSTGSTGDGYGFASNFGMDTVTPVQGLVAMNVAQNVSSLQGISLKNVQLSALDTNDKVICSEFGEMLFTNRGLSGPIALSVSSMINRLGRVKLSLDLKPALDEKTLDARILRDFDERKNQDLKNVTRALLPEKLNLYVLKEAKLQESKKVNSVTKEERAVLVRTVKNLNFDVTSLAPFSEAIITSGGVNLKDLKPSCESRNTENLYFIGETIDIDALTGGFNLQLAFSTAVAAANNILKKQQA